MRRIDHALEVIPDTGHLVFLEAPEKFRELILGFLGR
jgi:pimeloyl-ACP methyl ester carboxylesterase